MLYFVLVFLAVFKAKMSFEMLPPALRPTEVVVTGVIEIECLGEFSFSAHGVTSEYTAKRNPGVVFVVDTLIRRSESRVRSVSFRFLEKGEPFLKMRRKK